MLIREKKYQLRGRYSKKRLVFIIIGVFLLVGGVTLLWTSDSGPWSKTMPAIIATLGIVINFFQLPFFRAKKSLELNPVESDQESSKKPLVQVEGIELGIDGQAGALIIYAKKSKRGESVDLYRNHVRPFRHSTQNIVIYNVDKQMVPAAIFTCLEPGDYIARDVSGCFTTKITVYANQITPIEWRGRSSRQQNTTSKIIH